MHIKIRTIYFMLVINLISESYNIRLILQLYTFPMILEGKAVIPSVTCPM